jgi:AhpD family alkylhydroperoxidase
MARVRLPEGEGPESQRVWQTSDVTRAALPLIQAMYSDVCVLPPREREVARMKIAQANGCNVCLNHRQPGYAEHGVTEELYEHIDEPNHPIYSARETLCIEFATRHANDHRSIDDAFFARLKEHFADEEIIELTLLCGAWLGFGRLTSITDVDAACSWNPVANV